MSAGLEKLWKLKAADAAACSYIEGQTKHDIRLAFKEGVDAIEMLHVAEGAFDAGFGYDGSSTLTTNACKSCDACKPIRYPVADFKRSRSQEALWKRLPLRNVATSYKFNSRAQIDEHTDVAGRYFAERFPADHAALAPEQRLKAPWMLSPGLPIQVMELRTIDYKLVGASINTETENSIFGIYYYYDPTMMDIQPGKQIVLTLLDEAARMGKDYVYVGPWVRQNRSLAIKTQFMPYEMLHQGRWQRFDTSQPVLGGLTP